MLLEIVVALSISASPLPTANRPDVAAWANDTLKVIQPCSNDFLAMTRAMGGMHSAHTAAQYLKVLRFAAPAAHTALSTCAVASIDMDPSFMSLSASDQAAIRGDSRILRATQTADNAMRDAARAAQDIITVAKTEDAHALEDANLRMNATNQESNSATDQIQAITIAYS